MHGNLNQLTRVITIREANQEDISFIYKSWLIGYKSARTNHRVRNSIYFKNQTKVIDQILLRAKVYVACNIDDPTQLYGYICTEYFPNAVVLHWLYVKYKFRKFGIAKALILYATAQELEAQMYVSHASANDFLEYLFDKHNAIYDPTLKGAHGTN